MRGGGGRALVPCHPPPVPRSGPSAAAGGWPVAPGPGPPSGQAAWRRASLPAACSVRAVWQRWAPGAVWLAAAGSVRWEGGGGWCASPRQGLGRGARDAWGGGSLCPGLSLCPPRAGIEAGRSGVAKSPILHRLTSACRPPEAVRGVPLRAGAGLLACGSYCWSGRAADWGRAEYGPCGAPPRVPRPCRGGWGGGPPSRWPSSGCPRAWGEKGEGGGGFPQSPPVPRCCTPVAVGGWPDSLGPRGSAVDGGGAHAPPAPRPPNGR